MIEEFESILVVFQNPVEGRLEPYDDWYTNVHIRDAMRLDGAIATQRFIVAPDQPHLGGRRAAPGHWAHTIYEWESAVKSVAGHGERAGTPLMEISRDGDFRNLRDYFYRPAFLSHGWSREAGFRRGADVLTAMIVPPPGPKEDFVRWFQERHAPRVLDLPGFASVGLFTLHEAQSLPTPTRFIMAAIYSLTDRGTALGAWSAAQGAQVDADLTSKVAEVEVSCWQPRTPRLLARDVLNPSSAAAAAERRAREAYRDRYLTPSQLWQVLQDIG